MADIGFGECREIDFAYVNEILNGGLESTEKCSLITDGILQTMSQPVTVELVPEKERPSLYMRKHQADLNVLNGLKEILELDEEIPSIRCIVSIFENPRLFSDIIDACDEACPERIGTNEFEDIDSSKSSLRNPEYIAVSEDYVVNEEDDLDILSDDDDENVLAEVNSNMCSPSYSYNHERFSSDIYSGESGNFENLDSDGSKFLLKPDNLSHRLTLKEPGPVHISSTPEQQEMGEDDIDGFAHALLESTCCSIKFGHLKLNIEKWKQSHDELDEECNALTCKSEVFCKSNFKPIDMAPVTPSVFELIKISNYLGQSAFCDECIKNRSHTKILGFKEVDGMKEFLASRSYLKLSKVSVKCRERGLYNDLEVVTLSDNKRDKAQFEEKYLGGSTAGEHNCDPNLNSMTATWDHISSPEVMDNSVDSGVFFRFVKDVQKRREGNDKPETSPDTSNCVDIGQATDPTQVSKDVVTVADNFPSVTEEESQNLVKRICDILDKMAIPAVKNPENELLPCNSNEKSDLSNVYCESQRCPVESLNKSKIMGTSAIDTCSERSKSNLPDPMSNAYPENRKFKFTLEDAEQYLNNSSDVGRIKILSLYKKRLKKKLKKLNNSMDTKKIKRKRKLKEIKKLIRNGLYPPDKKVKPERKVFIGDKELNKDVNKEAIKDKNGFKKKLREEGRAKNDSTTSKSSHNSLNLSCSNELDLHPLGEPIPNGVTIETNTKFQLQSKSESTKKNNDAPVLKKQADSDLQPKSPSKHLLGSESSQQLELSEIPESDSNASSIKDKVSKSHLILTRVSGIKVSPTKKYRSENLESPNFQAEKQFKLDLNSITSTGSESCNSQSPKPLPEIVPVSFKVKEKKKLKNIICAKEFESCNNTEAEDISKLQKTMYLPSAEIFPFHSDTQLDSKLADVPTKNSGSPFKANISSTSNGFEHMHNIKTTLIREILDDKSKNQPEKEKLPLAEKQLVTNSSNSSPIMDKSRVPGSSSKRISEKTSIINDSVEVKTGSNNDSSTEIINISDDEKDIYHKVLERREKLLPKDRPLPKRYRSPVTRKKWRSRSRSCSRSPVRRRKSKIRSISPRYHKRLGLSKRFMKRQSPSRRNRNLSYRARHRSPHYRSPSPRRRSSPRKRSPSPRRRSPQLKPTLAYKQDTPQWGVEPASLSVHLTEASRTVYEASYSNYQPEYTMCHTAYQAPSQYTAYYDPSFYPQTDPSYSYQPPPHS